MPPKSENGPVPSTFEQMVNSGDEAEETALAEIPDEGATSIAPIWTDDTEFEADEVGFPRLRLGQGLTPEVAEGTAKMGQWLFSGFEPLDEIVIAPIQRGKTRAKREDPKDRDSKIVCTSPDAKQGHGTPGIACKVCPFSAWKDGPNGKRQPPECVLTYRYAVWIVNHGAIGEITFQKTAEIKAMTINNLIQSFGFGRFALKLTHSIQKGNNRIWAMPEVTLVPITEDMVDASAGLVQMPPTRIKRPPTAEIIDVSSEPLPV